MYRYVILVSTFIFVSILQSTVVRASGECPPAGLVRPCTCRQAGARVHIICENLSNLDVFESVFNNIEGSKFDALFLKSCSFTYIPASIFAKTDFKDLYIENTRLVALFDETPVSNPVIVLQLEYSIIQQGIRWSLLTNFDKLDTLIIFGLNIRELGTDFKTNVGKITTLRLLTLIDNGIRKLSHQPFENLVNLNTINLDNQKFQKLDEPLNLPNSVKEITMRTSGLKSLPDNFFGDRPHMSVWLDENGFTETSQALLGKLKYIYLTKNPIICNCKTKWILDKGRLQDFSGTCNGPSTVKGKRIDELNASHFKYCR